MSSMPMARSMQSTDFQPYAIGRPTYEVVIQLPQDRDAWYIHSQHSEQSEAAEVAAELMKIPHVKIRVISSVFDGARFKDKVLLNTRTADEAVWRRMFTKKITTSVHRELYRLKGQNDGLKVSLDEARMANRVQKKRFVDYASERRIAEIATAISFLLLGAIISGVLFAAFS